MNDRRGEGWSRRDFLSALTLASSAGLFGVKAESLAAELSPETTKLRLTVGAGICNVVVSYMAQDYLLEEGFIDVQYVRPKSTEHEEKLLASGETDIDAGFLARHIIRVDAGDPIVFLTGLHPGCFELFGNDRIRSIRDLKGKRVAASGLGSSRQVFLASMLKYVGLEPRTDVNWVTDPAAKSMQLFVEGKIDAFMASPPEPPELRTKKIGHVIVNTMMDKPWSQYFCCMVMANREFVRKNPVATKRAVRAILRAAETCSREPERAARLVVDKGLTKKYDYALEALKEIPYNKWREYDPEDTVRFYSLRLSEIGMIKSSPQKILAQGTDWRFLRELKKEMKG